MARSSTSGASLELPESHRIPIGWLLAHGEPPVRYRTLTELAPPGTADAAAVAEARAAVGECKAVTTILKKQKDGGIWGGNLLGVVAAPSEGVKELGTVSQYRRLLQLGLPADARPMRLTERTFFRVLSRDPDPALLFEWQKALKKVPEGQEWARETLREGVSAALAEAGHVEDPRLRGAGHRIATSVSQFLRSPLAEDPFVRIARSSVLHPEAHPPSWYSVAMLGAMPSLRRERAGFTERLGQYLAQPASSRSYTLKLSETFVTPHHLLLGDPIHMDARGNPKDIPLALHYGELLARMGALQLAPVATRALAKLYRDCDEQGVWRPAGLKAVPKSEEGIVCHYWPLQVEDRTVDGRSVDVTFRLAVIARLLGLPVEYV